MARSVTFVTRPNCGLCDEALPVVSRVAGRLGLRVDVVDVDTAGLGERLGDRVPVVLDPGGGVIAEGRMNSIGWKLLKARLRP